jgi:hypothetical protein
MRDASIEDMAAFWVARLMEKADWVQGSTVYLALIRHAATKYFLENQHSHMWPAKAADLKILLEEILASVPETTADYPNGSGKDEWTVPGKIVFTALRPDLAKERYAYYWTTSMWKSDFIDSLEGQFWVYRDYAHGAGKGKMAFLRELAEVWVAAATTALVRYAENDKRTWRATAKMLRQHADMVEADGLRALPWGRWGYTPEESPTKVEPEAGGG